MKAVVEANAAHLVYCVVVVCEVCTTYVRGVPLYAMYGKCRQGSFFESFNLPSLFA